MSLQGGLLCGFYVTCVTAGVYWWITVHPQHLCSYVLACPVAILRHPLNAAGVWTFSRLTQQRQLRAPFTAIRSL